MTTSSKPFGPEQLPDGNVLFRLWAPQARQVELDRGGKIEPMDHDAEGWFKLERHAPPGTLYRFRIDGKTAVPDPASHFQPEDVDGPSEVIDHSFAWQAQDWRGRPWHEAVIYELHLGAFSPAGTCSGAIAHLDYLVQLGVTAIELMPVAEFSGSRNWGYDGVLLFAPDRTYGRPEDLKALIDAAHRKGLMVLLDVVYNHFGPQGNYLPIYASSFFTDEFTTPWGASIDYRQAAVRGFAVQNALHWLENYRFDGLRLDAVHAIRARGQPSVLDRIRDAAGELAKRQSRHIHLVLENDDNAASLLKSKHHAGYRAQWNDDYHHAWHVLLTGETHGYYEDYSRPFDQLRRSLTDGFVYQGQPSPHRANAKRGEPSSELPPTAFVNFLQNHDQIGNRPFGDRLETLAPPESIEAALAITLLAPAIPMLFMGEEWGSSQPFPFFCDFGGDLAQAVRDGRRREFAALYDKHGADREPPDALLESTWNSARLRWSDLDRPQHQERLALVRRLLAIRRQYIAPRLTDEIKAAARTTAPPSLEVSWRFGRGSLLTLRANLSDRALNTRMDSIAGQCLWGKGITDNPPAWYVGWWLADPQ